QTGYSTSYYNLAGQHRRQGHVVDPIQKHLSRLTPPAKARSSADSNAFGCGFKATQSLPRRDSRPLRRPDAADFRTTGRPEPGAHTADSSAFSCGCSTSFPQAICSLWPPSRGSMSNRSMTAFRLASRYTALLLTVFTVASLIGLGPALAAGPPSGLGEVPV